MDKNRIFWPDFTRAVAILLVIIIHISAPVVVSLKEVETSSWLWANALDSIARISVPLFFMISGFLLLNKDIDIIKSIKRANNRILLPMIFWSFFYISYSAYEYGIEYYLNYNYMGLLKTPAQYHLWFFYDMLILYITIPFMRAIIERKLTIYFIFLCFLKELFLFLPVDNYFEFSPVSTFAGYMLAGHYIGNLNKIKKWTYKASAFIFFILFFVTFVRTYQLSFEAGTLVQDYYSYTSPNIIIMSICAFFIMSRIKIDTKWIKYPIIIISRYSLGIYGIHVFVIHLLYTGKFGFKISSMENNGHIFSLLETFILVLIISLFTVILISLIKPMRKIIS
ncbi:acyltransferase [Marinobacterium marinum]|uniref:Acyltransferase family protein n=1 Tax=Marinobacterium marinum TaxID=2756129 RepID=A0A7W1WVP3_9GAMM|nr:acyltransferase family protein [Marinobacterium marinum]MBA4500992.1 acyltransferase family protein [Marinobacterium marinum]